MEKIFCRVASVLIAFDMALSRIEQGLLFFGVLCLFCLIGFQVIARPLAISQQWTQELSQYILIAVIFCGASLGIAKKEHAGFEVLAARLASPLRRVLAVITLLIVGLFCAIVIMNGIGLVKLQMAMGRYTISFPNRYPIYLFYAIIPATFSVALFHVIVLILKEVILTDGLYCSTRDIRPTTEGKYEN